METRTHITHIWFRKKQKIAIYIIFNYIHCISNDKNKNNQNQTDKRYKKNNNANTNFTEHYKTWEHTKNTINLQKKQLNVCFIDTPNPKASENRVQINTNKQIKYKQ